MSYGDWAQYRRRYKAAVAEDKSIFGVNCEHHPVVGRMCLWCGALMDEWRIRHNVGQPIGEVLAPDAARRVAGL